MSELIDARGLGCAEPVILVKKALESENEVTIIVDQQPALENIKALGAYTGCRVDITGEDGGICSIRLSKQG